MQSYATTYAVDSISLVIRCLRLISLIHPFFGSSGVDGSRWPGTEVRRYGAQIVSFCAMPPKSTTVLLGEVVTLRHVLPDVCFLLSPLKGYTTH